MQQIKKEPRNNDLTIYPLNKHQETVIWLHGLGDSPYGFLPYFTEPKLNPFKDSTKIVLLSAPMRKVPLLSQDIPLNAWWDINIDLTRQVQHLGSKELSEMINIDQLRESEDFVADQIKSEIEILKNSQKVFVGGFSQGATLAQICAFNCEQKLGGLIVFGFYLLGQPFAQKLPKTLPIFIRNGGQDQMISCKSMDVSIQPLKKTSEDLNYRIIEDAGHEINTLMIQELREWFIGQC